eukprot:7336351-Prymnesium_polylepis.1
MAGSRGPFGWRCALCRAAVRASGVFSAPSLEIHADTRITSCAAQSRANLVFKVYSQVDGPCLQTNAPTDPNGRREAAVNFGARGRGKRAWRRRSWTYADALSKARMASLIQLCN